MNKTAFALLLFVVCALASFGQGGNITSAFSPVVDQFGRPVPGASVTVCLSTDSTPCASGDVSLYSDPALTVPLANPVTTDGYGNYSFWVTPGVYNATFSGQGLNGYSVLFSIACVPASSITGCGAGSVTVTSTQIPFGSPSNIITSSPNFTIAPNTFNMSVPSVLGVVQLDGVKNTTLSGALTAACNGTIPGKVLIPPGTFVLSGTPPSNCIIEGAGPDKTVLQATSGQMAGVIIVSGISNFVLRNLTLDGDVSSNTNSFDLLPVTNSSNVLIDNVVVRNNYGNGVTINAGDSYITLQSIEVHHTGPPLSVGQAAAIAINPGSGAISHVQIIRPYVHDNVLGFQADNSSNTSNAVYDVLIAHGRFLSNASDGISAYANANLPGGPILGFRVEDNETGCNGWPANGTGFSSNCTPGYRQTGSTASASGVGIDLIGPTVMGAIVSGNHSHDNVFDGISNDARTVCTVNTTAVSTTYTVTSGSPCFNPKWHAGEPIYLGGSSNANFLIAAVASSTSLTITTTAGTQSGITFYGPTPVYNSISNNQSYNNGSGSIGVGIFLDGADGDSLSANTEWLNNLSGLDLNNSSLTSVIGDHAYENARNTGVADQGIISAGYANNLYAVCTDDQQASPTQTLGVYIAGDATYNVLQSSCMFGSGNNYQNAGGITNTTFDGSTFNLIGGSFQGLVGAFDTLQLLSPSECQEFSSGSMFDTFINRISAATLYLGSTCGAHDGSLALGNLTVGGTCTGCGSAFQNSSGPGYQDVAAIAAPGNPAMGYVRLFSNSGSGNIFSCLTSTGANCNPSSGTVTSFSLVSNPFTPIFSCSVSNPSTTPALSCSQSNFSAHTFYGNNTASTGTPAAVNIGTSDISPFWYAAGGGSANAQTVTLAPAATALTAGVEVRWLPTAANTNTTPTLAVNGLTAKTITKLGATALALGDLSTTAIADAIYDGTEWQLQNPQTSSGSGLPASPAINGKYNCGYSVTMSAAVAVTCPQLGLGGRALASSTSTDTVAFSDNATVIDHDVAGSAAVTQTLPTATTLVNSAFVYSYVNFSAYLDTITPTTWTVNGAASLKVPPNTACRISVDPNSSTNWLATCATNQSTNTFATLMDGATVTWAMAGSPSANATLTFTAHGGSRTLNITNPMNGGNYVLWIKQDGTGGEGLTLGTGCTWKVSGGGSGAITPSTGASAIDVLAFTYDGTNCYLNFNKNFN